MLLQSCAVTDVGKKRPHNEDAYFCDDNVGLYVVADGMGGHAAGEVASAEAVDQIHGMVRSGYQHVEAIKAKVNDETRAGARRLIESAVQAATYMVYGIAELDPDHKGMGTTISAMLVAGNRAFIAQVGDSRVYVVRGGIAMQITEDHTWLNYQVKIGAMTPEQAKASPRQNAITRAVGIKDYVEVDTFDVVIKPDDLFILCSDGLHGYLKNPSEIIQLLGNDNLEAAAKRFVDLANSRGGKDNITIILVRVKEARAEARQ